MARDYTKYLVNNNSKPLSKRALALEIVRSYNTDNKPNFKKIKEIFPDEVQGSKGFIRKKSTEYDPKRFHEETLTSSDNVEYLVSNQWGSKNISGLIKKGENLGIHIKEFNTSDNQKKVIYSTVIIQYYKEDGNFGKDKKIGGYKTVTKHDNNGNLVESLDYDRERELWNKKIFKYNSKNNLSEEIQYDSHGKISHKFKYDSFGNYYKEDDKTNFDSKGRLQQRETFYHNGSLFRKTIFEYNKDGCIIKDYGSSGKLVEEIKRDNKNNTLEHKRWVQKELYDEVLTLVKNDTIKYEYDTMDNWIKKTWYDKGSLYIIEERKIEYS